jgi:hypothetical protein
MVSAASAQAITALSGAVTSGAASQSSQQDGVDVEGSHSFGGPISPVSGMSFLLEKVNWCALRDW